MRLFNYNILKEKDLQKLLDDRAALAYEMGYKTGTRTSTTVIMGSIVNEQIRAILRSEGL